MIDYSWFVTIIVNKLSKLNYLHFFLALREHMNLSYHIGNKQSIASKVNFLKMSNQKSFQFRFHEVWSVNILNLRAETIWSQPCPASAAGMPTLIVVFKPFHSNGKREFKYQHCYLIWSQKFLVVILIIILREGCRGKTRIFYGLLPYQGGGAPCIRIGVQEDIFVFDHILHFDQYPRLQLG